MKNAQIDLPRLVRINPGALERLGLYLARPGLTPVALLHSEGLIDLALRDRLGAEDVSDSDDEHQNHDKCYR